MEDVSNDGKTPPRHSRETALQFIADGRDILAAVPPRDITGGGETFHGDLTPEEQEARLAALLAGRALIAVGELSLEK